MLFWSIDITVLIAIMENIPTIMPRIVSEDLNLFVVKDLKARIIVSIYSYLKASTGSILAAV